MRRYEGGLRCQTTLVVLVGHGLRVGVATKPMVCQTQGRRYGSTATCTMRECPRQRGDPAGGDASAYTPLRCAQGDQYLCPPRAI
jgi:hypothetical protein